MGGFRVGSFTQTVSIQRFLNLIVEKNGAENSFVLWRQHLNVLVRIGAATRGQASGDSLDQQAFYFRSGFGFDEIAIALDRSGRGQDRYASFSDFFCRCDDLTPVDLPVVRLQPDDWDLPTFNKVIQHLPRPD